MTDLPFDVLDGIEALVDQNLVRRVEGADGELRYRMLETNREFAGEMLAAGGERATTRERHARYFFALAEEMESYLIGPDQAAWLARLAGEHDNLRAALAWAQELGAWEALARLVYALLWFWIRRGHYAEGMRWVDAALAADLPPGGRADALFVGAMMRQYAGESEDALPLAEECLTLRRALGDRRGEAHALNLLGAAAYGPERHAMRRAAFEGTLAIAREIGDTWLVVAAVNNLGEMAGREREYARARAFLEEGVGLARIGGDRTHLALMLNNLGRAAMDEGDEAAAETFLTESLMYLREIGDPLRLAESLISMVELARRQGHAHEAREHLE